MAKDASIRNVDELRQFGSNLTKASENLMMLFQRLSTQMHRVCEGWNDEKNRQFMADFEQKNRDINKMSQEMQQYAEFIRRICDAAEAYKSIR